MKQQFNFKLKNEFDVESKTLKIENGKIAVNSKLETSIPFVWAGGDCINSGEDLTVQAVEDGKQAAIAINEKLTNIKSNTHLRSITRNFH